MIPLNASLRPFVRRGFAKCLCCFAICTLVSVTNAQQSALTNIPPDVPEADLASELPRVPPRSPAESLEALQVLDGFEVRLVASEPLVVDPVAFAFDAHGGLFVVEMRDYSELENERLGRVARLTDTDGDGVMDHRTTYVENLSWPTAVWPWRDGVLVAEAPHVTWYRDTDQDGRSDRHEQWFSGFDRGNVQGLVNSLRWGVDGRIHGATSSSGATLQVASDATRLTLRGQDFAINPLDQTVAPESGGGQHGLCFNRWGDKFVTSNSDHLQQIIDLEPWLARTSTRVAAPSTRRSIAVDGPQAEVFRASPVEPWRIVRTRLRMSGVAPGIVEGGGRSAGYFTGATGTWIVDRELGFSDGTETALVCDVGSNLVHRKQLTDGGLYWSGDRIDQATELLRSSDIWFRPVQLGDGPDGAIYIADMAREVIEHPKSLPPMIKKHLDLNSGSDRGRIWRLSRTDANLPSADGNVAALTSSELVGLLSHPIPWQRRMASQLLVERNDAATQAELQHAVTQARIPEARVLALYILDRLGRLKLETFRAALLDPHDRVQAHTLKLLAGRNSYNDLLYNGLQDGLRGCATSSSARVQFELAQLAGSLPLDFKLELLRSMQPHVDDPLLLYIVAVSAGRDSWQMLANNADLSKDPQQWREWLTVLLPNWIDTGTPLSETHPAALQEWLVDELKPSHDRLEIWLDVLRGLPSRTQAEKILNSLPPRQREELDAWVVTQVSSGDVRYTAWIGLLPAPLQLAWLQGSFEPSPSGMDRSAMIESLDWANHPQLAGVLVERFRSMPPGLQQNALRMLAKRDASREQLLTGLENQSILPSHVPLEMRQQLTAGDNVISRSFQAMFQQVADDRQAVIDRYAAAVERSQTPSLLNGQTVFARACAQCHRLGGQGNDVGPPLKSLAEKSRQQLLDSILDPSREVDPRYASYSVRLQDGQVLSGVIREESSTQIMLAEAGGKLRSIPLNELEQLKSNGISFMPVGLEEQVTPEQMSDLLAYLQKPIQ